MMVGAGSGTDLGLRREDAVWSRWGPSWLTWDHRHATSRRAAQRNARSAVDSPKKKRPRGPRRSLALLV